MAVTTLTLQIKYENENYFELKSQLNSEDAKTIVRIDENGHLGLLWDNCQSLCENYFSKELKDIGIIMKG